MCEMSFACNQIFNAVAVYIDQAYGVGLGKFPGYLVLHELRAVSAGDLLEPPDTVIVRRTGNNVAVTVVVCEVSPLYPRSVAVIAL